MPFGNPNAPHVASVRVEPAERQLDPKAQQQLRVIATYTDGRTADVTAHAKFQSNNEGLAAVSATGLVSAGEVPGEAAVMTNFMGNVAVFRALLPRSGKIANYPKLPENNFIDHHVFQKLQKLHILPSALTEDADYLRRVYLDIIGTLPTADEARRFLADKRTDRRARLVDALLERPEYADYWALKWADVLRVDRQALGHKQAYAYYRWIRDSLAANKRYDQFVREIITAEGPLSENGPANFYKAVPKAGEAASSVSQVFLGVRIACAECHHHPFDRWSQTDYYGMQAFFTPVALRKTARDELLLAQGDPQTKHPRTGATVFAHALSTTMPRGVAERRSAADSRGLDDGPRESLVRAAPGQPAVGAFPRPRAGGADRRRPRHQSAHQPRSARRPGVPPRQTQVRCQGTDPGHHRVAGLSTVLAAECHQRQG